MQNEKIVLMFLVLLLFVYSESGFNSVLAKSVDVQSEDQIDISNIDKSNKINLTLI